MGSAWRRHPRGVAMRAVPVELGCPPVLAMVRVPRAHEVSNVADACRAIDIKGSLDETKRSFRELGIPLVRSEQSR